MSIRVDAFSAVNYRNYCKHKLLTFQSVSLKLMSERCVESEGLSTDVNCISDLSLAA